jgi:hypothetical protein
MQDSVVDKLEQVSKGALRLFRELKSNRCLENNLTRCNDAVVLTRTQKETLSRRLKELWSVDLIRKVKGSLIKEDGSEYKLRKGWFIINPDMVNYSTSEAAHLWGQCAKESK